MDVRLNHPFLRVTITAIACALLGGYGFAIWKEFRVQALLRKGTRESIEAALKIAPDHAVANQLQGRIALFEDLDARGAAQAFQESLRLNRFDSTTWLDLAAARRESGDPDAEQAAIKQALALDPTTPSTHWEAGAYYLTAGKQNIAIKEFAAAAHYGPHLVPELIRVVWSSTHDVNAILTNLPSDRTAYTEALDFFVRQRELSAAEQSWEALRSLKDGIDFPAASRYAELLIAAKQWGAAREVWQTGCNASAQQSYCEGSNDMVNGGFEEAITNLGFDWHLYNVRGVNASVDSVMFFEGQRSLKMEFDGNGVADAGVYQLIPVTPSTTYRLSAATRADGVISTVPVKLVLDDPATQEVLAASPAVSGSTDWKTFTADFKTNGTTPVLRLRILHLPSEPPLRGELWIDAVKLEAQ